MSPRKFAPNDAHRTDAEKLDLLRAKGIARYVFNIWQQENKGKLTVNRFCSKFRHKGKIA